MVLFLKVKNMKINNIIMIAKNRFKGGRVTVGGKNY